MTNPKDEAASEFEKFWYKVQKEYVNKTLTFKVLAQCAFFAGRASKGIRLPSEEEIKEALEQFIFKCELGGDSVQKQLHEYIKALNEGEGDGK